MIDPFRGAKGREADRNFGTALQQRFHTKLDHRFVVGYSFLEHREFVFHFRFEDFNGVGEAFHLLFVELEPLRDIFLLRIQTLVKSPEPITPLKVRPPPPVATLERRSVCSCRYAFHYAFPPAAAESQYSRIPSPAPSLLSV